MNTPAEASTMTMPSKASAITIFIRADYLLHDTHEVARAAWAP
jgi:hypothetical protein